VILVVQSCTLIRDMTELLRAFDSQNVKLWKENYMTRQNCTRER